MQKPQETLFWKPVAIAECTIRYFRNSIIAPQSHVSFQSFDIAEFRNFLRVDEAKTKTTAEDYCRWMKRFFRSVDSVSVDAIRSYLKDLKENCSVHYYCSNLLALKAYFGRFKGYPQLVASFKFPYKRQKMKTIPPKEDLTKFYEASPSLRTQTYFLMTTSRGLRRGEVLSLEAERDVNFDKRMLTPSFLRLMFTVRDAKKS